jgi:hypothetical protein
MRTVIVDRVSGREFILAVREHVHDLALVRRAERLRDDERRVVYRADGPLVERRLVRRGRWRVGPRQPASSIV